MSVVSVTNKQGVLWIQMCDQRRRNALGAEMLTGLTAAFDELAPDTRVVILRAEPNASVWCAGFDIRALEDGLDPLAPGTPLHSLFERIGNCRMPVIGMVQGSTWGGGTDLALRCDILIGDSTCKLAFTPARLGLPYDRGGLLNVLLRGGPALAIEMFATAEPIDADRALRTGLLNHLVSSDQLETFTADLARRIADNAPLTVSSAKRHLRALAAALSVADEVSQTLEESRVRALTSADYREGRAAFREKRRPRFTGS